MKNSITMVPCLSHKNDVVLLVVCCLCFAVICGTLISMSTTVIYAQDKNDTQSPAIRAGSSFPIVTPNPAGSAGHINLTANYTDYDSGVASVNWTIMGPNTGSSDPNLAPGIVGSSALSLINGTTKEGTWAGAFTFPDNLPDGNYLYSLTATDGSNNKASIGPFSGIILNRNSPDVTETKIVSVVDDSDQVIANDSTISSLSNNITFTFEGKDKSGVIIGFQCNLDDSPVLIEGEHTEVISTFSPCFNLTSIAQQVVGSQNYSNLLSGNHTFKVRAVDNEYNVDPSPSIFRWTNNITESATSNINILKNSTNGGMLDVLLEPIPYPANLSLDSMKFNVSFMKPNTNQLQDHVDFNLRIFKNDKQVFQATNQTTQPLVPLHVTDGYMTILTLNNQLDQAGKYLIEITIYGILFNPIIPESANFTIDMGS